MRALVAEDDYTSRVLLQRMLSHYGECKVAQNGARAYELYEAAMKHLEPFDLICLDIMMPEMDGHEVLHKIRDYEAREAIDEQDRAKIMMTTALADISNVRKAAQGRCDAYLVKPYQREALLSKLRDMGLIKAQHS